MADWDAYSDEEAEIVQLLIATDIEDLEITDKSAYHGNDREYVAACSRPRGLWHTEHFAAHVTTNKDRAKGRVMALERLMILIGQRSRLQMQALREMEASGL